MITEQDRLDAMENIRHARDEHPIELAIIAALDMHWLVHGLSINLGYYRTFIECSCGAGWWFGDHRGDPTGEDRWAIHRAQVIHAAMHSRWSRNDPEQ